MDDFLFVFFILLLSLHLIFFGINLVEDVLGVR